MKKAIVYFSFVWALFVFCCRTGHDLAAAGNILWTWRYTLVTLAVSLALGVTFGWMSAWLVVRYARRAEDGPAKETKRVGKPGKYGAWLVFAGSMILTMLAWLPAYLAYYPGICAYDFPVQMEQILLGEYVDHHPLAHTLLLRFFWKLGVHVLGEANRGIALLVIVQMLFLAGVLAYGITLLIRYKAPIPWTVVVQLWAMLYPFHWYMSTSVTKDTFFTGFFVLQIEALVVLLLEGRNELRPGGADILLGLSTVGMILFRNNGKYAMLVLLVVLAAALYAGTGIRKFWGRLLLVCLAAFLAGNVMLMAFFGWTGARQGDRREMLSIPIQQLARCMLYHGGVALLPEDDGTMDAEDADMIRAFLPSESYRYYQADFADPVKRYTDTSAALNQAGRFIRTYLHLAVRYPGDYLNAVLAVDAGYLYPEDVSHAYVNQVDYAPGKGYAQTRWAENELEDTGVYKASRWQWLHVHLEEWAENNRHLDLPVVKYLFVPGVFLWAYLFLAGVLCVCHRGRMCVPLALVLGYFATMLLGPVVQLRYIYPVMVALPFLWLLGLKGGHPSES